MQFLEATDLGVRSAVYRLARSANATEFALFPMVHVGSPAYYEEVARRLKECGLILVEGVRSPRVAVLTSWYMVIERTPRFGLVTQRHLSRVIPGDKAVNADMAGAAFEAGWGRIPLKERLMLYSLLPLLALYLRLFGTKEMLARHLTFDDLPSREEVLRVGEGFDAFDDLVMDQRDVILIDRIKSLVDERPSESRRVGIVYGAHHMRSVTRLLVGTLRYRVAGAEWITVFPL